MRARFFSVRVPTNLFGKAYVVDEYYPITKEIVEAVLQLQERGIARLYEEKPDYSRKPEATVQVATVESVLGKSPKKKKEATTDAEEEGNQL